MSTKANYVNRMKTIYSEQLPFQLEFIITANTLELQQHWSSHEP